MHVRHEARRGVLLLIVVSMLTLFLMLGTAYIVTASRARESARALSREVLFADKTAGVNAEPYLDEVLMRVLRGGGTVQELTEDANGNGVLDAGEDNDLDGVLDGGVAPSFESLLKDRYGDAAQVVTGSVRSPQIYSDAGAGNTGPIITVDFAPVVGGTPPHPAELNGLILTLTADGKPSTSHRIVRASAADSGYSLALTNPRSPHQWTDTTITDFTGDAIINGREFSGAAGEPNEAWDGFDYLANPYLAQVEPGTTVSRTNVVRPSFFDVAGWTDVDGDGTPDVSDPLIDCDGDAIQDVVDNDGDGDRDGVFLDWGFEPIPTTGGDNIDLHASVLIVDLDGRFNLNAHGSLSTMPLRDGSASNPAEGIYSSSNPNWPAGFAAVPLGSGAGPAEVNPDHLLSTLALNAATPSGSGAANLGEQPGGFLFAGGLSSNAIGTRPSRGRFTSGNTPRVGAVEGRYGGRGAELDALASTPPDSIASASQNGVTLPGVNPLLRQPSDDILSAYGVPPNWWGGTAGSYNSPPDLLGRMKFLTRPPPDDATISPATDGDGDGKIGLVPRPTFAKVEWSGEYAYSPYSIRLTSIGTRGGKLHSPSTDGTTSAAVVTANPYTLSELESILRPYDADASNLPPRLTAMLGTVAEQMRTRLTTESWDTTCIVDGEPSGAWGRLAAAIASLPTGSALYDPSPVRGALGGEISRGEKFNLNRPFEETPPSSYSASHSYYRQRQAYFKDLYTLICLLADPADQDRLDSSHGSYDQAFQREVAQWTANVVEFRDADSTMTPFEYDTNIFNGWDVDGDITTFSGETERGEIIWGLERPEVVLTSAVGWEDSTEDSTEGEIYVCIHRPWKELALDASTSQVANKLDPALAVGTTDDLDLLAVDGSGNPIWRFRVEDPVAGNSTYVPIITPSLTAAEWMALGKPSWPTSSSDLEFGGDGALLIRLTQTIRNAFLVNSLAGNGSYAASMPAAAAHLLRDDGAGVPDRELELFGVAFPPAVPPEGIDREFILHLERLSCPVQTFAAVTGLMEWTDPGNRIDNEDPLANGGDQDTSYLISPRYVAIDSIRLVVANRHIDSDMDAIATPPSHVAIQSLENKRAITRSAVSSFWRMNAAMPLGTGRPSPGADGSGVPGSPNLDAISVVSGGVVAALPWPNRPLISGAELLLVPNESPSEFFANYETRLLGSPVTDLPNNLLLEAVTVPTLFAGVHDSWVDGSSVLREQTGIDDRTTPVNQLSSYREPGRVNLNTVVTDQVWDAVVAGPLPIEDVDRDGTLEWDYSTPPNGLDPHPVIERVTSGGLTGADLDTTPAESMQQVLQLGGGVPVRFDTSSTYYGAVNVALNPLHKIYTASRLANTATVRSNVFAIWVTLRESISGDPDSVKYHRAFYIVDRSIPVGFEPGKDHNVRDAIRLRRIIE